MYNIMVEITMRGVNGYGFGGKRKRIIGAV